MAFNQLKKWVGTQLWSTFMTEYNENIDELNRVIDEFEGDTLIRKYQRLDVFYLGSGVDANDILEPFTLGAGTNYPLGSSETYYLITLYYAYPVAGMQLAVPYSSNGLYLRRKNGGAWGAWTAV